MGGWGSGKWTRYWTRRTVGSCTYLDVWLLRRQGALKPGVGFTVVGIHDFDLRGSTTEAGIELTFARDGARIIGYLVPVVWMGCYRGGKRPYFRCPRCGRRAVRLYRVGCHFWCRLCHNLVYRSQNEDEVDRAMRRQEKICGKLNPAHEPGEGFPSRRKRMRRLTYARLLAEFLEAGEAADFWHKMFLLKLSAHLDRIDKNTGWRKGSRAP